MMPTVTDFHLVAYALLFRGDRLLVARRAGVTYADGCWGLPGGHVEAGETLATTAAREAGEEVRVDVRPDDLQPLGMFRYVDQGVEGVDVYFRALRWSGDPEPGLECDAVAWCRPDALPDPPVPWLPSALDRLLHGHWFTESLS
jgi:8-oxo-dGTP diphosphatase